MHVGTTANGKTAEDTMRTPNRLIALTTTGEAAGISATLTQMDASTNRTREASHGAKGNKDDE